MIGKKQKLWNSVADKYGWFIHERYILLPALLSLFKEIKINNRSVVDIGCGIGIYSHILTKLFKCKVIGIDISKKMIKIARDRKNSEKIDFQVGDARKLLLKNETVDVAIMNTLLPNFSLKNDIKKSLDETYRVLKKDGILIISIPNPCFENLSFSKRRIRNFPTGYNYFTDGLLYILKLYKEDGTFVEVINYHWTLETYLKLIIESNFLIKEIIEPKPTKKFEKEKLSPVYMIIVAYKY